MISERKLLPLLRGQWRTKRQLVKLLGVEENPELVEDALESLIGDGYVAVTPKQGGNRYRISVGGEKRLDEINGVRTEPGSDPPPRQSSSPRQSHPPETQRSARTLAGVETVMHREFRLTAHRLAEILAEHLDVAGPAEGAAVEITNGHSGKGRRVLQLDQVGIHWTEAE